MKATLSLSVVSILFLVIIKFEDVRSQVNYPWMYYLPYGETVVLKPLYRNESESVIVNSCKWTTPKQVDLLPDSYNFDQFRYKIDKVKCELTIYDIQKDTNGIYHCTVNDFYISKAMLNVHGAPKNSLLEQWTPNLIAGFATFGGKYLSVEKKNCVSVFSRSPPHPYALISAEIISR